MSRLGLDMADVEQRRRRRSPGGVIAVVLALVLVVALLVGVVVAAGRMLGIGSSDDYPGPGGAEVTVEIPAGASLTQIGQILAEADVVRTTDAFVAAAEANDDAEQIQPGTYTLKSQMRAADAVVALLDPANKVVEKVTVPEGLRVSQVVDLLA